MCGGLWHGLLPKVKCDSSYENDYESGYEDEEHLGPDNLNPILTAGSMDYTTESLERFKGVRTGSGSDRVAIIVRIEIGQHRDPVATAPGSGFICAFIRG